MQELIQNYNDYSSVVPNGKIKNITASSYEYIAYLPTYACAVYPTHWKSAGYGTTEWAKFEMFEPIIVNRISGIFVYYSVPTEIVFYGSNDDIDYVELHRTPGIAEDRVTYDFTNEKAYKFYKLEMTSPAQASLGEIMFTYVGNNEYRFFKTLKSNVKNLTTVKKGDFHFTEDGDLYGNKNGQIVSLLSAASSTQRILFQGEVNSNSTLTSIEPFINFELVYIGIKNGIELLIFKDDYNKTFNLENFFNIKLTNTDEILVTNFIDTTNLTIIGFQKGV